MLSRSARAVLDTALQKYHPGRTDLIPVGGIDQLKPALRLMTAYRLVIQEVTAAEVSVDSIRPGHWLYEIKFDSHRAIALRGGNQTRILSRNQKDLGKKFQIIAD